MSVDSAASKSAAVPVTDKSAMQASRRGAPLVIAGHLASQLIGFGTLAVLYRWLRPEDYGLLGALLPAVMLPRMAATLGPGIAVLQQKDLSPAQLNLLFWLQAVAGCGAAVLTTLICWYLAFRYQEAILLPLGAALAAGTVFAALGNQHQALLERDLRFGTASLLRLVAQFVACAVAIAYAVVQRDVWALILQHVVELVVLCVGSWFLARWRPGWPRGPWQLGGALAFSTFYSLSTLVQYLAHNLDKILIFALFGAEGNRALGLYSQAFGLMVKPVYLVTTPLTGVVVSSLAKTAEGSAAQTQLATRFFRLCALGLFPAGVGLALVSNEVVLLLGGAAWRDAGLLLKLLAPSLIGLGLVNLATFVLAARGSARALLVAAVWLLLLTLQAAALGIYVGQRAAFAASEPAYGATVGLAAAFTLLQLLVWCLPFVWFTCRSVGLAPGRLFLALTPAALSAVGMGIVVAGLQWLLPPTVIASTALRLAILVPGGAIAFAAFAQWELRSLWREWKHDEPI